MVPYLLRDYTQSGNVASQTCTIVKKAQRKERDVPFFIGK